MNPEELKWFALQLTCLTLFDLSKELSTQYRSCQRQTWRNTKRVSTSCIWSSLMPLCLVRKRPCPDLITIRIKGAERPRPKGNKSAPKDPIRSNWLWGPSLLGLRCSSELQLGVNRVLSKCAQHMFIKVSSGSSRFLLTQPWRASFGSICACQCHSSDRSGLGLELGRELYFIFIWLFITLHLNSCLMVYGKANNLFD